MIHQGCKRVKLSPTMVRTIGCLSLIVFVACSKDKGDDDDGGDSGGRPPGGGGGGSEVDGGYNDNIVVIKSSAALGLTENAAAACSFSADNHHGEGVCLTPLEVSGQARAATLHRLVESSAGGPPENPPVRILGNLAEGVSEGGAINAGVDFDFASADGLKTNNQLIDAYDDRSTYTSVGIALSYLKVKFQLQDKFVTMMLANYSQPFADSEVVTECASVTAEDRTQSRYTDADLLPGMTFTRGDYLFCVKDTADAACAATDFKWLDMDAKALVTARPANPKKSAWNAGQEIACTEQGEGRTSYDLGTFGLYANIATDKRFSLWADYSHGEYSQQWPNTSTPLGGPEPTDPEVVTEPYQIYYLLDANGTETSGTALKLTLSYDPTGMVFVEDIVDDEGELDDHSLADLLAAIHPSKGQWGFDKKHDEGVVGWDADDMSSFPVEVQVELSGGTDAPVPL